MDKIWTTPMCCHVVEHAVGMTKTQTLIATSNLPWGRICAAVATSSDRQRHRSCDTGMCGRCPGGCYTCDCPCSRGSCGRCSRGCKPASVWMTAVAVSLTVCVAETVGIETCECVVVAAITTRRAVSVAATVSRVRQCKAPTTTCSGSRRRRCGGHRHCCRT